MSGSSGGTPYYKILNQTVTYPALLLGLNITKINVTVNGILATDSVIAQLSPGASLPNNLVLSDTRVIAANTVEVTLISSLTLGLVTGSFPIDLTVFS